MKRGKPSMRVLRERELLILRSLLHYFDGATPSRLFADRFVPGWVGNALSRFDLARLVTRNQQGEYRLTSRGRLFAAIGEVPFYGLTDAGAKVVERFERQSGRCYFCARKVGHMVRHRIHREPRTGEWWMVCRNCDFAAWTPPKCKVRTRWKSATNRGSIHDNGGDSPGFEISPGFENVVRVIEDHRTD